MDHHALTERGMAVGVRGGHRAVAMMDHAESMVMSMARMRRGGRYGDGAMVAAMAVGNGRRHHRVVAVMRGFDGGRPAGVMMTVVNQGKARGGRQNNHRQSGQGGGPQYNSHHSIPYQPRPRGRPARSQSCFNTMGTRPGKSSLTRPGPK